MRRFVQFGAFLACLWSLCGCQVIGLQTYRVAGTSMEPLLHEGDRIMVSRTYYYHHPLQDGDVIAFRHGGKLLIKRITATSGERIEGKGGVLILDGRRISEPFVVASTVQADPQFANFPLRTVPSGEIFVTGDNRAKSFDSRSPEYGPVRTEDVVGRFMSKY